MARLLLGEDRRTEEQIAPLSAHGPGPTLQRLDDRPIMHRPLRLVEQEFIARTLTMTCVGAAPDAFIFSRRPLASL